jgi:beta-propeller repeat-containing protein
VCKWRQRRNRSPARRDGAAISTSYSAAPAHSPIGDQGIRVKPFRFPHPHRLTAHKERRECEGCRLAIRLRRCTHFPSARTPSRRRSRAHGHFWRFCLRSPHVSNWRFGLPQALQTPPPRRLRRSPTSTSSPWRLCPTKASPTHASATRRKAWFVARLNPLDGRLDFSTYLGGNGPDMSFAIAVDDRGDAYVTGITQSSNFPTASQEQPSVRDSAFVTKLRGDGTALQFSTFLISGEAHGIVVDSAHNIYVTGTAHAGFSPVKALQACHSNCSFTTAKRSWQMPRRCD